jgi:hypothetical protein
MGRRTSEALKVHRFVVHKAMVTEHITEISGQEKRLSNPIVFSTTSRIGKVSAEADDEFLFNCFVDVNALSELR